jgi:hypothetical protein
MPEAMIAQSWPRWRAHRHSFNAVLRHRMSSKSKIMEPVRSPRIDFGICKLLI